MLRSLVGSEMCIRDRTKPMVGEPSSRGMVWPSIRMAASLVWVSLYCCEGCVVLPTRFVDDIMDGQLSLVGTRGSRLTELLFRAQLENIFTENGLYATAIHLCTYLHLRLPAVNHAKVCEQLVFMLELPKSVLKLTDIFLLSKPPLGAESDFVKSRPHKPFYSQAMALVIVATKLFYGVDSGEPVGEGVGDAWDREMAPRLERVMTRMLHDRWGFRKMGENVLGTMACCNDLHNYLDFCQDKQLQSEGDQARNLIIWSSETMQQIGRGNKRRRKAREIRIQNQPPAAPNEMGPVADGGIPFLDGSDKAGDHKAERVWYTKADALDHLGEYSGSCTLLLHAMSQLGGLDTEVLHHVVSRWECRLIGVDHRREVLEARNAQKKKDYNGAKPHPRPRGRAPSGKVWEGKLGTWVEAELELQPAHEWVEAELQPPRVTTGPAQEVD
eukprot:TRINITY_DN39365_c0_g2_i1.p1 TRINITY_DN39365_c0_g2~~TRINITY_DN39365_c0_g2_i1.p1  ORF type:complete len:442 (+),score=89.13 TRINITY_DN39365_c0_g2_i1:111-1436(+)